MLLNKKIILIITLLFVLSIFVGCASTYNEPISILFVGNSHIRTGYVPRQLQTLASLHDIEIAYTDVSRNGVNLDNTMRNNAINQMQNNSFDYVIMQARGRSIINDIDWFLDDIRLFSEYIRASGATPVLYALGWGRTGGQIDRIAQSTLSQAHKQAAYENDLILINAGEAWLYAIDNIPNISLFSRDGIHANHAGAFLTASVIMATLFDLQIENIPTGNAIDNMPMLNLLTLAGLAVTALLIALIKKRWVLAAIIAPVLLQLMSLFPHIFRFTEGGNRLLLFHSMNFVALITVLIAVYRLIRRLEVKWRWLALNLAAYILILIQAQGLRNPLYMGYNAPALAQAALDFVQTMIP